MNQEISRCTRKLSFISFKKKEQILQNNLKKLEEKKPNFIRKNT